MRCSPTPRPCRRSASGPTYNASTSIGSTIQLAGTGTYTTTFMKIAGFPTLGIDTNSTSAWGLTRMRVALVLDNTGSMAQDGKMAAMQTAAKSLRRPAQHTRQEQRRRLHLDRPLREGRQCRRQQLYQQIAGSISAIGMRPTAPVPAPRATTGGQCTSSTWTPANHNTWTGCVTDRDQDYDTKNTTPTSGNVGTLFPANSTPTATPAVRPICSR